MSVLIAGLWLGCAPNADECPPPAPVSSPIPRDPNPPVTEVITQVASPVLDALLVVGPMDPPSVPALVDAIPRFVAPVLASGVDFHVGLVTTAESDTIGLLEPWDGQPYLDRDGALESFPDVQGLVPADDERAGFDAIGAALDGVTNLGFRRDGPLHTLVVSSDDDASLTEPSEFVAWYEGLGPRTSPPTFSAIVPTDAVRYRAAQSALGGDVSAPEDDAWDEALEEFGRVAMGLDQEFFLSGRPTTGTVQVAVSIPVEGEPGEFITLEFEPADYDDAGNLVNTSVTLTFRFDDVRNSVALLEYVPEPGAQVQVTYRPIEGADPYVPDSDCPR